MARAMPRAAAMPTRNPVKLPGPVVTTTRSRSRKAVCASSITLRMSGISASAWPRNIGKLSLAMMPPWVSRMAAEQAPSAVSIASRRMGAFNRRAPASLHRPDFGDVGNERAQQILDAVAQRRRRRRAARAGAFSVEIDDAVLKTFEGDIAAVVRHRRPHPRLDQILDGGDGVGIGRIEKLLAVACRAAAGVEQGRARHEMFHDGAEDHRLELLPLTCALGHGDEIGAEEHAADAGDGE